MPLPDGRDGQPPAGFVQHGAHVAHDALGAAAGQQRTRPIQRVLRQDGLPGGPGCRGQPDVELRVLGEPVAGRPEGAEDRIGLTQVLAARGEQDVRPVLVGVGRDVRVQALDALFPPAFIDENGQAHILHQPLGIRSGNGRHRGGPLQRLAGGPEAAPAGVGHGQVSPGPGQFFRRPAVGFQPWGEELLGFQEAAPLQVRGALVEDDFRVAWRQAGGAAQEPHLQAAEERHVRDAGGYKQFIRRLRGPDQFAQPADAFGIAVGFKEFGTGIE